MKPGLFTLLLMASMPAIAQTSAGRLEQRALDSAVSFYQNKLADQLEVYSGVEYAGYAPADGTPFYDDKGWNPGQLVYNNRVYNNILIRYEAVMDAAVIVPATSFKTLSLYSPRISSFTSNGREFIYLDSLQYENLAGNGFYAVLSEGPGLELLQRKMKYLKEDVTPYGIERDFIEKNAYYALQNGKLKAIKSSADLFALMNGKGKSIQSALKKAKVKYKKNPELYLTLAANQYNQLP